MANSSANASKKMGTAKTSSKKKNKKPNKKAGRIALLVILCVLVVGMLTTAIIGGYVFFNIVSIWPSVHSSSAANSFDEARSTPERSADRRMRLSLVTTRTA